MAETTSNQQYLGISIARLHKQYDDELKIYDELFEQFKQSAFSDETDWDLIQRLNTVHQEVTSLKYILVVNVATYIEAIINFYLAQRLASETFAAIEHCKILDKWAYIVALLIPTYRIENDSELYCLLTTLITTRNSIAHMKPQIHNSGATIHKGNIPKHFTNDHSDRDKIRKWISLPDMLLENLCHFDSSLSAKVTKLFSRPKFGP